MGDLFIVCIVVIVITSYLPFLFFLLLFISYHEVQLLKLNTQLTKKLLPASLLAAPRIAWLKREEKLPQVEEGAKSDMGTAAG